MKLNKRFKKWLKTHKAKRLFSLCRWLHIYISTALFSLLVFFCVTGITLNHPSFGGASDTQILELQLPEQVAVKLNREQEIPLKAIAHFISQEIGLSAPAKIDLLLEDGEITFDYKLPGGYAYATVFTEEKYLEVEYKKGTFIGVINDLHKGRHSGDVWKFVLDFSAVLMLLFAISGLVILLQNAKQRRKGFYVVICGTISPFMLYFVAVPHF